MILLIIFVLVLYFLIGFLLSILFLWLNQFPQNPFTVDTDDAMYITMLWPTLIIIVPITILCGIGLKVYAFYEQFEECMNTKRDKSIFED